jgi:hypothetical protein
MEKNKKYIKPGEIDYQMPKKMADEILNSSGKKKGQFDTQEYLIEYVNNERGLLRNCVKVTIV